MEEELIPFGSGEYGILLGLLLWARAMDFLSTWVATPNLRLEANPLARKLGWRWGILFNIVICVMVARWPLVTIIFATTSVLVAARNFQSAWLMRSMGEEYYIVWMAEKVSEARPILYIFCLFAQAALFVAIGAALIWFGDNLPIPFGIGAGTLVYAVAVVVYSLLSYWKIRRRARETEMVP